MIRHASPRTLPLVLVALAISLPGSAQSPAQNGDVNADGSIDISDARYLLDWLFLGGRPPVPFEPPTPPSLTAVETMLPFEVFHGTLPNPAAPVLAAEGAPRPADALLDFFTASPRDPGGVVYVFHGGEGGAQVWLNREEDAALLADLVRHGFTFVLAESTRRPLDENWFFPDPDRFLPEDLPDWLDATVNADEMALRALHTLLGHDETTPVFLVGFSSGARFASAMASSLRLPPPPDMGEYYYESPRPTGSGGLNVRAAALYCNVGIPYAFGNAVSGVAPPHAYTTPTIFNYAENDPKNDPLEVEANMTFLQSLGVLVEGHRASPTRFQPDRLARVLGVSYSESRWIFDVLRQDEHFVDSSGFLTPQADRAPALDRLGAEQRSGVLQQFNVLRAEHAVMSDFHEHTIAFFEAQLEG